MTQRLASDTAFMAAGNASFAGVSHHITIEQQIESGPLSVSQSQLQKERGTPQQRLADTLRNETNGSGS